MCKIKYLNIKTHNTKDNKNGSLSTAILSSLKTNLKFPQNKKSRIPQKNGFRQSHDECYAKVSYGLFPYCKKLNYRIVEN